MRTISLKLLKAEYENSGGTTKVRRRYITEQQRRICKKYGCTNSLAFRNSTMACCTSHRKALHKELSTTTKLGSIHKKPTKKENQLKKKRYYEKHGITFNKNLHRAVTPATATKYITPEETTLIYKDYKEPLKPLPKSVGYGYYGVLAQSEDREYIQCHICGNLFMSMGLHIRLHKITAKEYKTRFGFAQSVALCSDVNREVLQQSVFKPGSKELPSWLDEYNRKVKNNEISAPRVRGTDLSLETRNKLGLCPQQVLEKVREYADELGRAPSYDEFRRKYNHKYISSIKYFYGTYSKAVKKLKLTTAEELWHPNKENLLTDLQDFYKLHNRIPMTSDFNRGLLRDRGVYIRQFGTLNNARIEAGLDAVLPMPFGQLILLAPEQYLAYKAGKPLKELDVKYYGKTEQTITK